MTRAQLEPVQAVDLREVLRKWIKQVIHNSSSGVCGEKLGGGFTVDIVHVAEPNLNYSGHRGVQVCFHWTEVTSKSGGRRNRTSRRSKSLPLILAVQRNGRDKPVNEVVDRVITRLSPHYPLSNIPGLTEAWDDLTRRQALRRRRKKKVQKRRGTNGGKGAILGRIASLTQLIAERRRSE